MVQGFTKDYAVKHLVWYEPHESVEAAIQREKAIKHWRRPWKLEAIEKMNPEWIDLWPGISGDFELTVGGAGGVDAMMRVLKVQPWER